MTPEEENAREWARKAASILEESGMEYMVMVYPNDESVLTKAKATAEQMITSADKIVREIARATGADRATVLKAMMLKDLQPKQHMDFKRGFRWKK